MRKLRYVWAIAFCPLTLALLVAASPAHAVTARGSRASMPVAYHGDENEPDENEANANVRDEDEPEENEASANEPDRHRTRPRNPAEGTSPPKLARPRPTRPKSGTPKLAGTKGTLTEAGSNPAAAATSGSSSGHGLPIALTAGGLALTGIGIGAIAATRRRRPSEVEFTNARPR